MPSQRTLSSRWHDVFSARVKLACPDSVAWSNPVQTSGRLRLRAKKTKRAMQGERKPCKGAKGCARAVRGGLPPGFRCNCEGFLGFPRGFPGVSVVSSTVASVFEAQSKERAKFLRGGECALFQRGFRRFPLQSVGFPRGSVGFLHSCQRF